MLRGIAGIGTAIALLFAWASSASAVEVGDDCVANAVEANRTMIPWGSGSSTMHPTVGEFELGEGGPRGVITRWGIRVAQGQPPLPQRLEVYRVVGEKGEYRQEFQTPLETIHAGDNFFPARIPVWVGANLGLYGPNGTFACDTGESVVTGTFEGSADMGEVRTVTGLFGFRTPVTVVVERDQDRDGYGDETQDLCRELAAHQGNCPVVTFEASSPEVKRRAILLSVTISTTAWVAVSGEVSWSRKPSAGAKRGAGQPKRAQRVTVALDGGIKEVAAGTTARFRIPLPTAVTRRLAHLDPAKLLVARLSAAASDSPDLVKPRITKRTAGLPGRKSAPPVRRIDRRKR